MQAKNLLPRRIFLPLRSVFRSFQCPVIMNKMRLSDQDSEKQQKILLSFNLTVGGLLFMLRHPNRINTNGKSISFLGNLQFVLEKRKEAYANDQSARAQRSHTAGET
jgi:hypothetical protein